MSTYYSVYIEIKDGNNEWKPVMPYYINREKNELQPALVYWNGSRTYFGETFDKLMEISISSDINNVSPETLKHYFNGEIPPSNEMGWNCVAIVTLTDLHKLSKHGFDCSGFVTHTEVNKHKNGETDWLHSLTPLEFAELPDDARLAYEYYEWYDPYGWCGHIKEITEKVNRTLCDYCDINDIYDIDDANVRIICIHD